MMGGGPLLDIQAFSFLWPEKRCHTLSAGQTSFSVTLDDIVFVMFIELKNVFVLFFFSSQKRLKGDEQG